MAADKQPLVKNLESFDLCLEPTLVLGRGGTSDDPGPPRQTNYAIVSISVNPFIPPAGTFSLPIFSAINSVLGLITRGDSCWRESD